MTLVSIANCNYPLQNTAPNIRPADMRSALNAKVGDQRLRQPSFVVLIASLVSRTDL
jgi:hypothetical protein